jgi:hypothetical protein
MPLVMAALAALVWPYYDRAAAHQPGVADNVRPLHDLFRRVQRHPDAVPAPGTTALLGDYAFDLSVYLWQKSHPAADYNMLVHDWPAGMPLGEFLARRHVSVLYLNDWMIHHLEVLRPREAWAFLNGPLPPGWRCVDGGNLQGDRWRLYTRGGPGAGLPASARAPRG